MISFLLCALVGFCFIVLGYWIGIRGKITLLHSYHYAHVKEQDKRAYTRVMGAAVALIGLGLLLMPVVNLLLHTHDNCITLLFGFVFGFALLLYGQYKYNGSIFSLK